MTRKRDARPHWRQVTYLLALLCLGLASALPAAAQFDTGTISGVVVDPTGALLPGASVVLQNLGTGHSINLTTDSVGGFDATTLPFGVYTVTSRAPGFQPQTSEPLVLNVGATVRVTLKMAAGGNTVTVRVTGTPNTIDTESPASRSVFNATEIANLPINGRDVSDFLEASPGSVFSTGEFQGSVNGMENIFSGINITLDGQAAGRGDINGYLETEGQELSHVTRASVESIQEIDFTNSGYTAETGHSLGPQMNIVTKGGTNNFHGNVYEFLRNDSLDAHDYFDAAVGGKQPLKLNQFGGNVGGPIIRNRLFFFTNYEGNREHLTNVDPLNHTLSAYVRSELAPTTAYAPVLAQMQPLPAGCTAIPAPDNCAYPNSTDPYAPTEGADLVYAPVALPDALHEDTGSARLDWTLGANDSLLFRYNINDSLTQDTYGPSVGQISPQALRTQLGKLDETHIFNSTLFNQASIAFNRFYSHTSSDTPQPYYAIGTFDVDLGSLPGANAFNQTNAYMTYELFDNVSKIFSNSELKAGIQIRNNRQVELLAPEQIYDYANLLGLLFNAPFILDAQGYAGSVAIHNTEWSWYAQDNWHINRNLVLNAGLRYEYNTVWREGNNQMENFDVATQSFLPTTSAPYSAPLTDIEPRIGLSYDPTGTGKTVIHAYGGIFVLPTWLGFGLVSNLPQYANYSFNTLDVSPACNPNGISFPSPNPQICPGTQTVTAFPQHPKDPTATNWLLGVEQQLPDHFVLAVNYTANRVQHQQAGVNFAPINDNPLNPVTSGYQNYSGYATEDYAGNVLFSNYNSLQALLRRHYRSINMQLNYTWSHELDDVANIFNGFSDPFDPKVDYSSGDVDVRQNLTASAVYDLPQPVNNSLLNRQLLGGWQASTIVQARSGLPQNITLVSGILGNPNRPDYVSGQPLWVSGAKWPNASYNINAFQLPANDNGVWGANLGTVGRNALRGPAFAQWDLSLMKNFPFTETAKIQLRGDLFNVLNHPNFNNPDGGICSGLEPDSTTGTTLTCTAPNPDFGKSSSTIQSVSGGEIGNGTMRQLQVSAKIIF